MISKLPFEEGGLVSFCAFVLLVRVCRFGVRVELPRTTRERLLSANRGPFPSSLHCVCVICAKLGSRKFPDGVVA